MVNLSPKGVADKLRDAWKKEPPPVSPEDRHQHSFLEAVCKELGVEPNAIHVAHAAHLMAKHEVGQHHPHEYPKMLVVKDKLGRAVNAKYPATYPNGEGHPLANTDVILQSEEHEDEVRRDLPHLFEAA